MEQVSSYINPKYTIPEPRSAVVRRQRLVDFLHKNVDQPLQLICAPAGYGKTTLMADFANDTDLTVCWYSIDELDRDPRSFTTNLFEALRARFPSFVDPSNFNYSQSAGTSADWQTLVGALDEGIRKRIPEYFVLIIDDFHIISSNEEVLAALDQVLQRLPDNCRVILSTRELPQLVSLPRLISQRMVAGVGPAELRFTADEIKDLLKKNFDLDITDREAQNLEQESEGWITAILLTTHSLWKGLLQEVLNKQGQNTLLYEYMASEVFSQQPTEIQNFLQVTSIFNEFDAEWADALTNSGDSDEMLREIEGRNLFVTRLEGPHPWYRYHHLFRDFLRDKMTTESPDEYFGLHNTIADYFVTKDEQRPAINHYIQGQEYAKALDLLESQMESLAQEGLWETLGNWLEQIPSEYRENRPVLLLQLATVYQRRSRNDDAIRILTQVIEVFKEQGEHVSEAQALMRRSVALRAKGAAQMAVRDARQALSLAQEHGTLKEQSDARCDLGRAYGQQGKMPRAEKELRLALEGYQQLGDLFKLSYVHGFLGLTYTELGDFARATNHFEQAIQGWRKLGNQRDLSLTLNNMACLYYQEGRYEDSEKLAHESIEMAKATNSTAYEAYARTNLADVYREQGKYDSALTVYQEALDLSRESTENPLISYCLICMGETYRMVGDSQRAKSLLKEGMVLAHELSQDNELGLVYTSLGIIEGDAHKYDESVALLNRACHLLTRSKQKRHLARARFHLADTLFQTRSYPEAMENLREVSKLCDELGHYKFLIEDARRAALMVQYAAASKDESQDFFARLKDEVNLQTVEEVAEEESTNGEASSQTLTAPQIEVSGFGTTRIKLDGNTILSTAWGSAKAREMFLFMLFNREPMHKEKIVEALWPHISSSKANANFHSTLHRMKSALYPNCVDRDGEMYQLNEEWEYEFDVQDFEILWREAEDLPSDDSLKEELLSSVIDLYQGTLLEDIDSGWCNQLRTELEFKFWKAY